MAKVRYSQFCAGGCRTWLTSGTVATHLHGGWWCHECLRKHREVCLTSGNTSSGDQRPKSALSTC